MSTTLTDRDYARIATALTERWLDTLPLAVKTTSAAGVAYVRVFRALTDLLDDLEQEHVAQLAEMAREDGR